MDEVEISISAIKNLKMVHFYHISKNDSVLSAAMIQYDSDKMLNLSVLDKHYDEFVSMIFMVYEKEADERSIVADDYTRSILQTMKATDTGYYSRYMSKLELLSKPLYYHQSYMPYIAVPIIKYVIEQLYSIAGKKIFWNPLNSNWFGKGTLAASFENGEKHVFPYVLSNDEIGSYTVDIGNFFENRFFLNMKIRFDKDGIAITAQSDGAGIMCNMNYIIDTEGCELNSHCDIELKGKPVYNENAPIKHCTEKKPSPHRNIRNSTHFSNNAKNCPPLMMKIIKHLNRLPSPKDTLSIKHSRNFARNLRNPIRTSIREPLKNGWAKWR